MKLFDAQTIFFHGIGGAGMRGLAWILSEKGKAICGTDLQLPDDLPTAWNVAPEVSARQLLSKCDLYIFSDAVPRTHQLRQAAEASGVSSASYQQAIGVLSKEYTTVAVAGTHGKSSTTAFLSHVLVEAGLDPTVLIGASIPNWPGKHARVGDSDVLIVEADEYRDHFLTLYPAHEIITTIEHDHPDYFPSIREVTQSFQSFINLLPNGGTLTIPESLVTGHLTLPANTKTISFDQLPEAPLPGQHMQMNAALAIAVAERFGISSTDAAEHLQTFPGLGRRFETIGNMGQTVVISDYAHHPTEITATLTAARQKYPDKKIAIIFEAHTLDRLAAFAADFAKALSLADGVVLYPPFIPTGREQVSDAAISSIATALSSNNKLITTLTDKAELKTTLQNLTKTHNIVLACTAGQLDAALRKALESVNHR